MDASGDLLQIMMSDDSAVCEDTNSLHANSDDGNDDDEHLKFITP